MKTYSGVIGRSTQGNCHILDLTGELQTMVHDSQIAIGQLTAMIVGSTGALSTVEFDPGLVETDLAVAMERLAPAEGRYQHEATWPDDNGHSHVRATFTGPSLALPVVKSRLPLGRWQQVILLNFDTRPPHREVVVTILGN